MLDKLPREVIDRVAKYLGQEDKISLTYVSKEVRLGAVPRLYKNLFLNERYYMPSDYDRSLGTRTWSVLKFTYNDMQLFTSTYKFKCLIRTLKENNTTLCPLINAVHCTWHLERQEMMEFIDVVNKYASNLTVFENFIRDDISRKLVPNAAKMQSLTITPRTVLPQKAQEEAIYYDGWLWRLSHYNLDSIRRLTVHINVLNFFTTDDEPLRLEYLCLNLRKDTFAGLDIDPNLRPRYFDIFDRHMLKQLSLVSWYDTEDADINMYDVWQLGDFFYFPNVEDCSLVSLYPNVTFLKDSGLNWRNMKRLKVDYICEHTVAREVLEFMAICHCSQTLEYLELRCLELGEPLLSYSDQEDAGFRLAISCQCDGCQRTLTDIIRKKYLRTADSFKIRDFHDVESRNFVMQMFKLFPILPHSQDFDCSPAIGYVSKPIAEHVTNVNKLLHHEEGSEYYVTEADIIALYHMYVHSLRKPFDYLLSKFPKLRYLALNDVPTAVVKVDQQQTCNIPIFYSEGYKSNQVYELVNDESLFH
ncbi:uncharacterized protein KNAG_0I01020 [Huiozyma naganishii CBS 8797]|uniref:F-box domain-containing protein n=1 Tax=Huiozyma naganishii (strain ATCC MYA-139 / BCRC 22969 / CBS 8797 / KCTC 17520 / NBRC 10181 / NCYC 3082 / Yp74L-3) TaxID=1071383 RepID=J7RQ46_HUIN7|nr:hypothetical protein KNAG_0I01020 [Kazachstania naganishii CBS 8797]CCK71893.1 hypothetical protein KNAG_0I01020 [Kazachstania naganishii CBS 8797]